MTRSAQAQCVLGKKLDLGRHCVGIVNTKKKFIFTCLKLRISSSDVIVAILLGYLRNIASSEVFVLCVGLFDKRLDLLDPVNLFFRIKGNICLALIKLSVKFKHASSRGIIGTKSASSKKD